MKDRLVVIGGGGHAKVCIDIILQSDKYEVIGFLDKVEQKSIKGIPYLGNDSYIKQLLNGGIRHAFVAVGDNMLRKRLSNNLIMCGCELVNVISPYAYISDSYHMGWGNVVMPGAVINTETVLGNGCIVNTNSSIDHEGRISDYVHIAPGCSISGNVSVGEGAFLGTGTNVVEKIFIGAWSQIGAGSAVIENVDNNVLAYGVPARIIRSKK